MRAAQPTAYANAQNVILLQCVSNSEVAINAILLLALPIHFLPRGMAAFSDVQAAHNAKHYLKPRQ